MKWSILQCERKPCIKSNIEPFALWSILYFKNTVIKQINYTDHWMWRGFCFCSRIYNRLTQLQIGHNILLKVINHVGLKENYLKNLVIGLLFSKFPSEKRFSAHGNVWALTKKNSDMYVCLGLFVNLHSALCAVQSEPTKKGIREKQSIRICE